MNRADGPDKGRKGRTSMSQVLPLPAVILGGSDRRAASLPAEGREKHALAGYKGARVQLGGRPLAAVIVERLRETSAFDPVFVVGPADVYRRLLPPDQLIDADGTFGTNIRAGIDAVLSRCPGRRIAFVTCDILPDPAGLRRLMQRFAGEPPCDVWFPLVRAPSRAAALGQSAWKPAYRVRMALDAEATSVLPGHLAVIDPAALRLEFAFRLLDAGYRTRNQSIDRRRGAMLRGVFAALVREDLTELAHLRAPTVTWTMLRAARPAVRTLRDGTITVSDLERALRTLFVRASHRRRHPAGGVRLPIVDELFLARDIDTVEEARELGASVLD